MSSNPSPEPPDATGRTAVTNLTEYRRLVAASAARSHPTPPPDPAQDAWDRAWDEEDGYTFRLDNS